MGGWKWVGIFSAHCGNDVCHYSHRFKISGKLQIRGFTATEDARGLEQFWRRLKPQMSDVEGDLYDDLMDTKPAASKETGEETKASSASTDTARRKTDNNLPLSLVDQLKFMEERVAFLEQENLVLKRNIGTLYRTAKREISRKDRQISQMQDLDKKSTIEGLIKKI
eukprot:scaffold22560_cov135-Cylindrotheca_fusiformis.AAC.1